MSGQRRNASEVERDRRLIATYYLQGHTQAEIAEEVKLSQATVSRDLKAIQEQWRQASILEINEAKARELAKIDLLEREYWVAWERSLDDLQSKTIKARGTKEEGKPYEQTIHTSDSNGDPRYLAGIQWCIERRCQILGIDAPRKFEHGGKDGKPIAITFTADDLAQARQAARAYENNLLGTEGDATP
jgi:transposase